MEARAAQLVPRPPVVVVMGHIDHGKSTLLDRIRRTNLAAGETGSPRLEAGGITQALGAWEVERETAGGKRKITFLDTPGHEAFLAMRQRGAQVADIAILVVASDDGVKPQTLEALETIASEALPHIVAINKTDKAGANPERVKKQLAEAGVLVEGYGGKVPVALISAKTGEGVSELLDLILLAVDLEELRGEPETNAQGYVLEARLSAKVGVTATVIIKNGSLWAGDFVVVDGQIGKAKRLYNGHGEPAKILTFSSPATIWGLGEVPPPGAEFRAFNTRGEAEAYLRTRPAARPTRAAAAPQAPEGDTELPVIIKAETMGAIDAISRELARLSTERVRVRVISSGVGSITESDVKLGLGARRPVIIGFNVRAEKTAADAAAKAGIPLAVFDVIYKLSEWLAEEVARRTPRLKVETVTGRATVLKLFGATKDRQIVGGTVLEGILAEGRAIKVNRRGNEVGTGKIIELQQQKLPVKEVVAGKQFGALVESKLVIAPGDELQAIEVIEK